MEKLENKIETSPRLTSFLRVNHAGERAAVKIYEGQLKVLSESRSALALQHMLEQETQHYNHFNSELQKRQIHPTLLQPLWDQAAYGLGIASALWGPKAAMACTVAIEEVIEQHYAKQLKNLPEDTSHEIQTLIETCREEELGHKATALSHEPEDMKGYKILAKTVKAACRLAIWLSERL
jgi:ubiquinone biosynthesis monooxygenase Coq7